MAGVAFSYRNDPSVPTFPDDRPIFIFDGHCGLCSGAVRFTLKHDRRGRYRYLAAQSALGTSIYKHYELDPINYETFILLQDGRPLLSSDAVIELFRQLGGIFSLAVVLKIVPRPARDWAYGLIARYRMRFFGRRDSCFLPDAATRDRFLAD